MAIEAKEGVKTVGAAVKDLKGDMCNIKINIDMEKQKRPAWWMKKKERTGWRSRSRSAQHGEQLAIEVRAPPKRSSSTEKVELHRKGTSIPMFKKTPLAHTGTQDVCCMNSR